MTYLTNFVSARPTGLRLAIISLILFGLAFIGGADIAKAQAFTESFDTVTQSATPVPGWTGVNNSENASSAPRPFWFQTNTTIITPQSGGAISANYNNTTPDIPRTISNWLISPSRTLSNGDVITFYTSTVNPENFADRLQVRLSLAGTS